MKKVFLQTQFGKPHAWTQEYIDHVQNLAQYGWYWKIFTPNDLKSKGNVEVIKMTLKDFDELITKKCGVDPHNYLQDGVPHKFVSDYYPAYGLIFEDYIKGFDFWGHTNWDIVYGRLDHFLSDAWLDQYDIWSDDVNTINGIFTLYRNNETVNNFFRKIPNWESMFVAHNLFGIDEYYMTDLVRNDKSIRFGYPPHYALHSHDRLDNHDPSIRLERKEDGSLWELFKDINPPAWAHARPIVGKEIMMFHFLRSKRWPL